VSKAAPKSRRSQVPVPCVHNLRGITIFVCALLVVTVWVSTPQVETIWSVFETPGDLIRVVLGLIASIWIVAHLFMLPKDAEGYRTWVYLGLALAPLALACAIAVW